MNRKDDDKIQELKDFVKDLKEDSLDDFFMELEEKPKKFQVYKSLSEPQWKELYGARSVFIFNHLHPAVKDDEIAALRPTRAEVTLDKFQSLIGTELTQDERRIFWTNFSNLSVLIDQNEMTPRDAKNLRKKIKATLKSATAKQMINHGYVFDGLLATGSNQALLYKVIEISTYKAYCAKVYPLEDKSSFEIELNASNMIHKESLKSQIVCYKQLSFCHTSSGSDSLGLLMPLFKISLHEILEANRDTPVPLFHFFKIAKNLVYAGFCFQNCGYAHCDIKPSNIMMNDEGFPVVIDLGAVTKLGDSCVETTRFYCLDSSLTNVDSTFDLNCIIVTLAQCFICDFEVRYRTRDHLKVMLAAQTDKGLQKYADLCLKLLDFDSCEQAHLGLEL